jgi:hypothetical protein
MRLKSETFKDEQENIRQRLLGIIQLQDADFNPEVKTITLSELDNPERKQQVLDLIPDIRKYYAITNKAFFNPNDIKRMHMTIIREILKPLYKIQSQFVVEGGVKNRRYHFYPLKG